HEIRVIATTTDILGGTTSFTSATQTIANVDYETTGTLDVTGNAEEGGTLTASLSNISDPDGETTTAYQWQLDGADITGATSAT
ncbi:hypothetical protein, partial [Legionella sp. W05-934-2]|uniref:hypothetical protein n=1 Tax=Legionella sp. W05-934-2 TaxID=1198649 RepID=UPI003461EBF7